jgi:fructan beta-fructosidase
MSRLRFLLLFALAFASGAALLASARPDKPLRADIVFADFEGTDYGDWKVTGTAFGKGPAKGTLPNQMPVTGYKGKGLVNSFHGGDASTGTLTSPEFTIRRKYISFLIGGGHHPGKTCIDLVVDGKVVRTATGPNKKPGGTEHLDPASWEVSDLAGKKARIRIVDEATGGWGHINIDHIVFTDQKPVELLRDAKREIAIDKRYLRLPVKNGASKRNLKLVVDGRVWREMEIELADEKPDFTTFVDLRAVKGTHLTIQVDRLLSNSRAFEAIKQTDEPVDAKQLYQEKHRPQFHFTSRRGWLNDPNGLVYYKGEYHLFYQHNPYGWNWGNMHWGHAVSKDLVHWQELPIALYPRQYGDWAFSGSAVVDIDNTSRLKSGKEDVLIAAYTSTGRGECIASSNDRGRTWTDLPSNPVVKHQGRDPRLLWHAPSKRWVMAVYDEHAGKRWIAFYTSPDLKKWQFQSRIEDFFECPDLFELTVDGKEKTSKWILHAADGQYLMGTFDGKAFKKESGKHTLWYGNFYAAQTFSNAPAGRRIQIGWGNGITFPGMPFNQQMTIPCELTLRTTAEGVRMFALPVKEIETLHGKKHVWKDLTLKEKDDPLAKIRGVLFDVRATLVPGKAQAVGLMVGEVPVLYDAKKQALVCKGVTAPLKPVDGKVALRVLVDRGSIEVFGNDGAVAMSVGVLAAEKDRSLGVFSRGEGSSIALLEVIELRSAWRTR